MKFKAAILEKTKTPLQIGEVTIDRIADGDVLVRLGASGLCHTDLEVIEGQLAYPLPIILGHEGAGTVEAVGAGVTQVRVGDKVICSWNPNCGHCFYCTRNQPILCEPFAAHQPKGRLIDGGIRLSQRGQPVHHFSTISTHAQYCVVSESSAIAVSRDIPDHVACLIGCGVMTGVGAACRFAPVQAGAIVVVVGCGAVGLNVVQGARLQSAGAIIAIDPSATRRSEALKLGASIAIDPKAADAIADVRKLSQGRGADVVFESAGSEAAMQLALDVSRPGGEIVILGKVNVDQRVSFRFGSMMGERRITRSSYGGARPRRDFPWLAGLYLDGKLKLDQLVSERIPLSEINSGFDRMRRGETIRSVIDLTAS